MTERTAGRTWRLKNDSRIVFMEVDTGGRKSFKVKLCLRSNGKPELIYISDREFSEIQSGNDKLEPIEHRVLGNMVFKYVLFLDSVDETEEFLKKT